MLSFLVKRFAYGILVLIGVNILTFMLFFKVNSPDAMARFHLGVKHVNEQAVATWKQQHGYDKPLFYNSSASGMQAFTDTIFYKKSFRLFFLDFGLSDRGRSIWYDIKKRIFPSISITLPALLFGTLLYIGVALTLVFFRYSYLDTTAVMVCILLMSISSMFFIIGMQYVLAYLLKLFPISGYAFSWSEIRFVALPIIIAIVDGLGVSTLWYRAVFLAEIEKDFVRTAHAKGLTNAMVLYRHVLRNGLIPIVTGLVTAIPALFVGSLILESFFSIPGMGSYTIDAIRNQDFSIVRSMVFIGSALYILALIATDILYTVVDPRVRLK